MQHFSRTFAALASGALLLALGTTALAQGGGSKGAGYWHTSGSQIIDSQGNVVRIAGINWYGFETPDFIVHGLYAQDYKTVLNTIKSLGYNVIRVPYSNEMVESNPVPTNFTQTANGSAANTDLVGQSALQDLDSIVAYAGSIGLRIILDNHRSEAGESNEASGLWYTSAYPQANWVADWQMLATRYMDSKFTFNGNPTVIGMDLRNEPHGAGAGGSCWTGDTASSGCPATLTTQNWPVAAAVAGNAVLAINPHLLIFVEGNDCYNGVCGWQGGNLMGVATNPVTLNVPNQLVYSPHDYGPNLFVQPWFNSSTTPQSLDGIFNQYWGYISAAGTAPIWLGEFGTDNTSTDIQGTGAGSQGQWFQTLTAYLQSNPALSWTYFALNGEDSYALLDANYDATPVSALKQSLLAAIQAPLGGGTTSGGVNTPGFTLASASPTLTVNQGSSATDTITVTDTGGFTGAVTLAASGLPSGVTANFGTNPATGTSVLTLAASSAAAAGSFTANITGTSGSTTAKTSVGVTVAAGAPGGEQSGGGTAAACHIGYTISDQFPGGFTAAVTINNTGTTDITSWTLTWAFANGQTITSFWNGTEMQNGANVTVKSLSYNGDIPAGGSYSGAGFQGTWNNVTNAIPTAFALNGVACN